MANSCEVIAISVSRAPWSRGSKLPGSHDPAAFPDWINSSLTTGFLQHAIVTLKSHACKLSDISSEGGL